MRLCRRGGRRHRSAVDADDHIALDQTGLAAGEEAITSSTTTPAVGVKPYCCAQRRGQGRDVHAEVTAPIGCRTTLLQLRQQRLHLVDRYGKPNVLGVRAALGTTRYRRVHADDLTRRVVERPARVARVDGSVGLDQVLQALGHRSFAAGTDRSSQRGDDALGDRGCPRRQTERVADGDDRVAHDGLGGTAKGNGRADSRKGC